MWGVTVAMICASYNRLYKDMLYLEQQVGIEKAGMDE